MVNRELSQAGKRYPGSWITLPGRQNERKNSKECSLEIIDRRLLEDYPPDSSRRTTAGSGSYPAISWCVDNASCRQNERKNSKDCSPAIIARRFSENYPPDSSRCSITCGVWPELAGYFCPVTEVTGWGQASPTFVGLLEQLQPASSLACYGDSHQRGRRWELFFRRNLWISQD